jgi:hypothetical protein
MTGCANLGEIEGMGKFGEILRAVESTRIVLGGTPERHDTAPVVNRTVGEIKQLKDKHNVTSQVQSIKYIFENIK